MQQFKNQRTKDKLFGMVTFKTMRDPNLTLREKAIYAYLCTYADAENNTLWVGINKIANECGISQSSVSRIIDQLIKKNVIKRTFRGKGQSLLTTILT